MRQDFVSARDDDWPLCLFSFIHDDNNTVNSLGVPIGVRPIPLSDENYQGKISVEKQEEPYSFDYGKLDSILQEAFGFTSLQMLLLKTHLFDSNKVEEPSIQISKVGVFNYFLRATAPVKVGAETITNLTVTDSLIKTAFVPLELEVTQCSSCAVQEE